MENWIFQGLKQDFNFALHARASCTYKLLRSFYKEKLGKKTLHLESS